MFGPIEEGARFAETLHKHLQQIGRVRNLTSLADAPKPRGLVTGFNVELELLLLKAKDDPNPIVVPWSEARTIPVGQFIEFRIQNKSVSAADVTLLFVDQDYGIDPIIPGSAYSAGIRVPPQKNVVSQAYEVSPATRPEHAVLIAVRPKDRQQPVLNLAWLAQPSLESATRVAVRTRGPAREESPLEKILFSAMYAKGQSRGLRPVDIGDHALQMESWRVVPDGEKK